MDELTAIEPSPTADATRFTLPERMSPTAKTPGTLVSSIYGGRRCSGQILSQIRAGLDEVFGVHGNASAQPAGIRFRPRHQKHMPDIVRVADAGRLVSPSDSFQMPVALDRFDFGPRPYGDLLTGFDSRNQISRHGLGKSRASNQHIHMSGGSRKEDRRLTRGVSSTTMATSSSLQT